METEIYEDDLMSGLTDEGFIPCQMCGEMHPEADVLKCADCGYVSCGECQEEHLNSADCPEVCTHCLACCALEDRKCAACRLDPCSCCDDCKKPPQGCACKGGPRVCRWINDLVPPEFDFGKWGIHEQTLLKPALKSAGYDLESAFFTGDGGSLGPLTRCIKATDKGGQRCTLVYG